MPAPIVFFDIAGPDQERQRAFYEGVFGWAADAQGGVTVPLTGATLRGTLRQDPAGAVLYLGVADVSAALEAIVREGGTLVAPRFEVPGVVVLGLFTDPAGNRLGLIEMDGDTARIP